MAVIFGRYYFWRPRTNPSAYCSSTDPDIPKHSREKYLFYLNQDDNSLYISTEVINISDFKQVYTDNSQVSSESYEISHLKLNKCTCNGELKTTLETLKLKSTKLTVESSNLTLSQIENLIELLSDVKTLHLNSCNVQYAQEIFLICISEMNIPEVHLSNLEFSGNSYRDAPSSCFLAGKSKPLFKHLTVDNKFITYDSHDFHI